MSHVVVLGGGFAGLAAATALAERGIRVTVLEARAHLGGRARSFPDTATGMIIDNGQHAMMGCYTDTFAFLDRIGASAKVTRQRDLTVPLYDLERGYGAIAAPHLPGPLHMVGAVSRCHLLTSGERWAALRGGLRMRALHRRSSPRLATMTVTNLLDELGQPAAVRRILWHPIAIATLNEVPDRAAAAPFLAVLGRALFGRRTDAQFVLPAVGLSELYTDDARRHLEARGGRVITRSIVVGFEMTAGHVRAVRLRDGTAVPADACVAALPSRALSTIRPPALPPIPSFETSPIVSTHLWFDRPILNVPFLGLVGTRTHWVFDRTPAGMTTGQQLSAVVSADRECAGWDPDRVATEVEADLRRLGPHASAARCLRRVVVKEREATIALTVDADRQRPGMHTPIPNLMLAGDWIATGLPPTIESATLSGHRAASAVLTYFAKEAPHAFSAPHHDRHGPLADQELVAGPDPISLRADARATAHL